jgi:hypothetical protein
MHVLMLLRDLGLDPEAPAEHPRLSVARHVVEQHEPAQLH